MIEEKLKILEIVKELTSQQVDDLIKNTEKLWKFLHEDTPLEPMVQQKNSKPIIDIINEKVDSDKTLTDPLKKEYTKHMLVSNFIEEQLEKGLNKLCFEIDEKLGVKNKYREDFPDKLLELYITGLVPYGVDGYAFSSGENNSNTDDLEPKKVDLEKINSEKVVFTGREEIDKNVLKELMENTEPLLGNSEKQKNFFINVPFGKVAKNNSNNIPRIIQENIPSFSEEREKIIKNVKEIFKNLDKNIPSDEHTI